MKWKICYSGRAFKFIRKNRIEEKIKELLKNYLKI